MTEPNAKFTSYAVRLGAPLAVLLVAVACVTFNGGISVGASNHVGLLPVVRRILDPNYLPNDFNISLRLYHHRVFAYVLAGLSALFGEARGIVLLHVAGALLLSWALWFLCRTLRLSVWSYLLVGACLATGFAWTGRGLEENDFLGNPEIQPPLFAHAFALLATALLIRARYLGAAFCAGLTVFFHLQIGVIFTLLIAPLYALRLRAFTAREVLQLALAYLLPASFALAHLLAMLQRGLLRTTTTTTTAAADGAPTVPLATYIDFRHPHHFALFSAQHGFWYVAHLVALALLYWHWRRRETAKRTRQARATGVLLALSVTLTLLALAHFVDYYLIKHDKFASLQVIRVSPLITIFGTLAVTLAAQNWLQKLHQRVAQRWLAPLLYAGALAVLAWWGWRVAQQPEADFTWGVRSYNDLSDKRGARKQWVDMCNWIKANGARDTVYLTPPANDGFTALTDRSNVVEFKINPDGALQMNEWFARLRDLTGNQLPRADGFDNRALLNQAYGKLTPEQLLALGQKYRAGFAVVPKQMKLPFEVIYANQGLQLVKLPPPPVPTETLKQ